jgi:hypothetical protein
VDTANVAVLTSLQQIMDTFRKTNQLLAYGAETVTTNLTDAVSHR